MDDILDTLKVDFLPELRQQATSYASRLVLKTKVSPQRNGWFRGGNSDTYPTCLVDATKELLNRPGSTPLVDCVLFNARSLANKLHVLRIFQCHYQPNFHCTTESWLGHNISDSELIAELPHLVYRVDTVPSLLVSGQT